MKSRVQSLLVSLALAVCAGAGRDAPAQEPEARAREPEAAREDELFGGEDKPSPPPAKADAASPLDEPVRTGGVISDMLQKADDPLQIGGQLSLRFQYAWADEHAPEPHLLSSPSRLYLFLDSRPNDRVRAFVRGRLDYDFTLADGADASGLPAEALGVALDQLWLKADVGQVMYLTIGRQPIRWGCGRFWNPTDFLNRTRLDPLAIFDERLGVGLLKLHLPFESLGWNFYAIGVFEQANTPERVGGAVRGEFLFGETEVSLSAAAKKGEPSRIGATVSSGVGLVDLRLEGALLRGIEQPFFRGEFDPTAMKLPESYSREDDWIPQGVAGADLSLRYSDEDSLTLGGEYFFNDAGYDDSDLYPWLYYQGTAQPLYLGRHYAAAYFVLPMPGTWNDTAFQLSCLGNLSDRSFLGRLDYRVLVLTFLNVNLYAAYHFGENGELHYSAEVPAIPGVPELKNGIAVPAPLVDVGAGLSMSF
jgi:hypothetical protein